jgi:hypothetical protein
MVVYGIKSSPANREFLEVPPTISCMKPPNPANDLSRMVYLLGDKAADSYSFSYRLCRLRSESNEAETRHRNGQLSRLTGSKRGQRIADVHLILCRYPAWHAM